MPELKTPVALFVFNRPDLTERVFSVVRAAQPGRLFLVADGPRPGIQGEEALCMATRRIVEAVDWPCQVEQEYALTNLGCGYRVASGLDWVFDHVDEAIILEDDTLPDLSFFAYCQALLERFRTHDRLMGIGGYNGLGEWRRTEGSYFFHRQPAIWGWASWRRAWRTYDITLERYRTWDVAGTLAAHFADTAQVATRVALFHACLGKPASTWDIQWSLICQLLGGLWISPRVNLISNLGFDGRATHTAMTDDLRQHIRRQAMPWPLVHPDPANVEQIDADFDHWLFLMQTLNSYRDVRALRLWLRALDQNPRLSMPDIFAGGRTTLEPLRKPAELLAVLAHTAPHMTASPRVPLLQAALAALMENP